MGKLKEMLSDWRYIKFSIYIVATSVLLYILYFIISNLNQVLKQISLIFGSLLSAFSPLIIGLILAYLLSPLVDFFHKKLVSKLFSKLPTDSSKKEKRLGLYRTVSILITYLLIVAILCLIIYGFAFLILGNLVFSSAQSMMLSILEYFNQYETVLESWVNSLPSTGMEEQIHKYADTIVVWISNHFSTASIVNFVSQISGSVLNMILGMVISIYLLKDKEFFIRLYQKTMQILLPKKANDQISSILFDINDVISKFLRGQILDAVIIASLSSIGLSVIGLDFSVFIGCFAGLCNIIPYFGPIISMVPALLVGLITGGISQALLAILVLIVIQQIDSNIIYPKVVGSSIGLHPLFILISVTVGGYYGGIIGMILAVPTAAIIKVLVLKKLDSVE